MKDKTIIKIVLRVIHSVVIAAIHDVGMKTSDVTVHPHPRRSVILALVLLAGLAAPAVAATDAAPASAGAALPRFDVLQYVISGNSVLGALAIELAVTPHMGERKTLSDVEAARAALEKAYQDAGYLTVVVTIPEQSVDTGEVALQVVEGVIDRLRVKGAGYTLPSAIKAAVPELAEGTVPNFTALQAQVAALNRGADARVTPVLKAGALPGTVEVQLDVDDQLPLHGSVELSNRQTPNTTATRLSASLRYDNLWQRRHSLSLTLQAAPQRLTDARVATLSYVLPLGQGGDVLSLYAVHSRSQFASLANAPGLGLLGNSDTLGLRWTKAFGAGSDTPQSVSAGLDSKNIRQTVTVRDGGSSDSPIAYVPLVASYNASLIDGDRLSGIDLTLTSGIRGLLGNSDARFAAKRVGASASFLSLRAGLAHTEPLGRWAVYGKLDLQHGTGPLVPTEQMVAGGADSVRGYLEGERAGDGGLRGTLELRSPRFALGGANSEWRIGGVLFADAARLRTLQAVAPQPGFHALRGAGVGLRLSAPAGLGLEADLARALVAGDTTRQGALRLHARAVWAY